MSDRYKVATCHGYLGTSGYSREGVAAVVLDTAYCYGVVAQFTSEETRPTWGVRGRRRIGDEGAVSNARDLCAWLNRNFG